jgi:hypothetical protein
MLHCKQFHLIDKMLCKIKSSVKYRIWTMYLVYHYSNIIATISVTYCYQSVNAIRNGLSQSDPIKRRPLSLCLSVSLSLCLSVSLSLCLSVSLSLCLSVSLSLCLSLYFTWFTLVGRYLQKEEEKDKSIK